MQVKDFSEPLKQLLDEYKKVDLNLAKAMQKPNKSFEGCVNYIKSLVSKQNKDNKFSMYCRDEELVRECAHYFQEDSLDFEPKKKAESKPKTKEDNVVDMAFDSCDWGDDDKEESKPKIKTVKAPSVKRPTNNNDGADDIFGGCDW